MISYIIRRLQNEWRKLDILEKMLLFFTIWIINSMFVAVLIKGAEGPGLILLSLLLAIVEFYLIRFILFLASCIIDYREQTKYEKIATGIDKIKKEWNDKDD